MSRTITLVLNFEGDTYAKEISDAFINRQALFGGRILRISNGDVPEKLEKLGYRLCEECGLIFDGLAN